MIEAAAAGGVNVLCLQVLFYNVNYGNTVL